MTTVTADALHSQWLTREAGGWIALCQAHPEIEPDALALLAQSEEPRPGNLRYAVDAGEVYLRGESRGEGGFVTRSASIAVQPSDGSELWWQQSQDEIAGLLAETAYAWSPKEDAPGVWQAVASDAQDYRCELTATSLPTGVEVRGVLTTWDTDLCDKSRQAVACFLLAAHTRIRFARFALQSNSAVALSLAAAERIEVELADSASAVVAACQLVWRELRALAHEELARLYLEASTR